MPLLVRALRPWHASSRRFVAQKMAAVAELPWEIRASVCVERHPRVTPPLNDIEERVLAMLRQKEVEESLLGDHELKLIQDEAKSSAKTEVDATVLKTGRDLEDEWQKELGEFPLGSRQNARGSRHQPDINLQRPVCLLVQRMRGSQTQWTLPMAKHVEGETLRQTAERAVRDNVGSDLSVQILGHAPWAVFNDKYSKAFQHETGRVGAKVFIYKAHHLDGAAKIPEGLLDYQWALREELWEALQPKESQALQQILYDDEP